MAVQGGAAASARPAGSFALAVRPASSSPAVRAARAELELALDVGTLGRDLGRVSLLLTAVSSAARGAGCGDEVAERVSGVRARVHALFHETRAALAEARAAAEAALETQLPCVAQFAAGDERGALESLRANDARAESLAARAEKLAADIGAAGDEAAAALEEALVARDAHEESARAADAAVEELHRRRANAWHSHATVLQSLAECGRLYAEAEAAETAARRKAAVCGLFSFVRDVDAYLVGRHGLPVLAPVSAFLADVQGDAVAKKEATRSLLDAKRRQRRLSRDALDDMAECSRQIRQVQSEAGAAQAAVHALCTAAKELRRLAATVLRVAHFWAALRDSAGRLSSREYVALVEQVGAAGVAKLARARASSAGSGDEGRPVQDAAASGVERIGVEEEVVAAGEMSVWLPCAPVKRRHVQYYSKWVALAEVCGSCVAEVDAAGQRALAALNESEAPASPGTERKRAAGVTEELEREIDVTGKRLAEVIDLTDDSVDGLDAGEAAAIAAATQMSLASSPASPVSPVSSAPSPRAS